ncbi:MAG TPA: hypothetical protein VGK26_12350 [Thermoanaerobaculia bacterium]|jgi:hypothetical protein
MSFQKPTSLEYGILGLINLAVCVVLALRQSWTAAYFGVIAIGCFGGAIRARSGSSTPR